MPGSCSIGFTTTAWQFVFHATEVSVIAQLLRRIVMRSREEAVKVVEEVLAAAPHCQMRLQQCLLAPGNCWFCWWFGWSQPLGVGQGPRYCCSHPLNDQLLVVGMFAIFGLANIDAEPNVILFIEYWRAGVVNEGL